MFSFIRGKLIRKTSSVVEVEANGLGFEIFVPLTSLSKIGDIGTVVLLHTLFLFREDSFQIFGFTTPEEKEIFRELIKISGVGPKIALAILSYLEVDEFIDCVTRNEVKRLTELPGVGKKTAERVLLEFREKVKRLKVSEPSGIPSDSSNLYEETISALNVLGYQEGKVRSIVLDVMKRLSTKEKTVENVLKLVLRELVK